MSATPSSGTCRWAAACTSTAPSCAGVGLDRAYDWDGFWKRFDALHLVEEEMSWTTADKLRTRAHQQVGSLGGGNHFVEVCRGRARTACG